MLLKNALKKVKKSLGRYLSLLIIIFLGVGFYSGIIESVPNIKDVQTKYYKDTNLMDLKLLSTLGFNDDDISSLKELEKIDTVVGTYSKDVIVNDDVVRVHAIEKEINGFHFIEGRMPTTNNECLADGDFYKVGDKIIIEEKHTKDLENKEYTVVGTVFNPIYTSDDYGTSDIGNGKLYSYIYIPKENFQQPLYTEVFLTIKKECKDVPYSKTYNDKLEDIKDEIKKVKENRLKVRIDELIDESYGMLTSEMFEGSNWYIQTRDDIVSSYTILESQYEQVTIIANVIPVFFILIVALMTSNTMARMITEERGEMGTLTSLGFSNFRIISTYLMYVLSSTVLGSIIGFFVGTIILPQLVYTCFPLNFPEITYNFRLSLFLICIIVSCLLMTIVTIIACNKELKQKPAYLLRPEAPKKGKIILLEKVGFIWNKLSFSSKITFRNISRYKKRVFMTLVGTAGCTFLIMIGFGLRDSINTVGDKQYSELFKYENMIILSNNITEIDKELNENISSLITKPLLLNQATFKVVDNKNSLNVYLITPEDNEQLFKDYYILRKENQTALNLDKEGVIITPKVSERFKVKVGDFITIESLDKEQYKVKVSGITENYVSNYIYMNKTLYQKTFNKDLTYNVIVSKNIKEKDIIATSLLETDEVISVNFSEDLLKTANEMVKGLNDIVILLVVISSLLAFTVLYNLTSINISERTREIATLKVLGFKDQESNEYIYRETLITVVVGIIIGLLITPPLHKIVMELLEVDVMIFLKTIKVESYIFASTLTLSFAIIMQIITYFKLKKIDMIESLKSVE